MIKTSRHIRDFKLQISASQNVLAHNDGELRSDVQDAHVAISYQYI